MIDSKQVHFTAETTMKKNRLLNMFFRFTSIVTLVITTLTSPLVFAEPSATTKQEINHLFSYLKASGCEFNRNGTWYSSADAATHLNKKYEYLVQKNMIASTEDFIENAATKSSMSGKSYQVKCKNAAPVESAVWFKEALLNFRKKS